MNSNRYGAATAAYREVQERHEDIKRIERTITELAQLFNDVRTSPAVTIRPPDRLLITDEHIG